MFAILETSAPAYRRVDSVGRGGPVAQWLGLAAAGIGAKLRLLAGLVLFIPLRMRHGGEGR